MKLIQNCKKSFCICRIKNAKPILKRFLKYFKFMLQTVWQRCKEIVGGVLGIYKVSSIMYNVYQLHVRSSLRFSSSVEPINGRSSSKHDHTRHVLSRWEIDKDKWGDNAESSLAASYKLNMVNFRVKLRMNCHK